MFNQLNIQSFVNHVITILMRLVKHDFSNKSQEKQSFLKKRNKISLLLHLINSSLEKKTMLYPSRNQLFCNSVLQTSSDNKQTSRPMTRIEVKNFIMLSCSHVIKIHKSIVSVFS